MPPAGFFPVQVRGDNEYRQLLRIVAAKRGQTIADVTREALDALLKQDLADASFFQSSEKQTSQSKRTVSAS